MADLDRLLRHGIPIVAGVVLLGACAWVAQRDAFEREHWTEQRVKVVGVTRLRNEDEWAPIVEFDANGTHVQHTGSYSTSKASVGSEVFIRFDPADPEKTVRVLQPLEALVVPATFGLGLAALLTGVIGALRKSH